jgi:hypothetical protein
MDVALLAWPIKRLAVARLTAYANGTETPPAGVAPLVSTPSRPVQVSHFFPTGGPERVCIYGVPLRAVATEQTAEDPSVIGQTAIIEFRVRVYEPGEDVTGVDWQLGDLCTAVATALLEEPLFPAGRIWLSAVAQEPQELTPNPDPSVTAVAALVFSAEALAYA